MSDLRRALTRAVYEGDADPDGIVDRVIECLVHEPLIVVLSGLSEEVIARRARGKHAASPFRA